MPRDPSPRLGLVGPDYGDYDDGPDVVEATDTLIAGLEAAVLGYDQGGLSGRPAAGTEGRLYFASDPTVMTLYHDTGTAWLPLAWQPGDIQFSARMETGRAGWLPCDGAAVSRTTYAALFAAIGTVHGVGNGSTTFNVPDAQGRAPVGSGAGSGLTRRVLGDKVGEEAHALTVAEVPALHIPSWHETGGSGVGFIYSPSLPAVDAEIKTRDGGGGAHNNMQPSIAFNCWIKV